MRRTDRQIDEKEAFTILENGEYGILSMVEEQGQPYSIPLNYCVMDNAIYFHSATEGKKTDLLLNTSPVCFCVVGDTHVQAGQFSTLYESCIIQGSAEEVSDNEKINALEKLLIKYSTDHMEKGLKYIEKSAAMTRVYKISINEITGKAKRG